ncbi:MAG TPA: 6-bladed beta-propeller [Terriglobales bacterium]|nr:6-bladed beta-propeller [Terriglobales bacterium]
MLAFLFLLSPGSALGRKKKAEPPAKQETPILARLDYSRIVWPNPPEITRIKFVDFFLGQPAEAQQTKQHSSWMDRLAGTEPGSQKGYSTPLRYQLWTPYGLAVDSDGRLYVADARVGAIFIFDPKDKNNIQLIKNGGAAHFGTIIGLAIDDDDRLFVSDSKFHHVLVFSPDHKVQASMGEGMAEPAGVAIDRENRFLYVADTELDQVLVYDADSFKLLRKIGTPGHHHELTTPGDFAKPTNVAVDKDGNLYVADTLNDRVEIFDADGEFIRAFGKNGDGPGYFARPKGIAVDSDGHVWVADAVQNRVQVFDRYGRLLIWMGGPGLLPGQFSAVAGLTIDPKNRVFTSEQYPGRVQMFQYVTQAEALTEYERREAERQKPAAQPTGAAQPTQSAPPAAGSGTQ